MAELGILADLVAVLAGELAERGAEEVELLPQFGELRCGQVIAEGIVGSIGMDDLIRRVSRSTCFGKATV